MTNRWEILIKILIRSKNIVTLFGEMCNNDIIIIGKYSTKSRIRLNVSYLSIYLSVLYSIQLW